MKYIFLDIDGVLNDHAQFSNSYCGIKQECVEKFNRILKYFPEAKIVISSAWRYMVTREQMTLQGFEYLLLTHGVDCYKRIAGHTREDAYIDEPRINQIFDWLEHNDKTDDWIAIDDLSLDHKNCHQTDAFLGLTDENVSFIIG